MCKRKENLVERERALLTQSYQANIGGFLRMKVCPISQWWRLVLSPTNHHELFNLKLSWAWEPMYNERACGIGAGKRSFYLVISQNMGRWSKAKRGDKGNSMWKHVCLPKNFERRWINVFLGIDYWCNCGGFRHKLHRCIVSRRWLGKDWIDYSRLPRKGLAQGWNHPSPFNCRGVWKFGYIEILTRSLWYLLVKCFANLSHCMRFPHVRRQGNSVAHNLVRHARHITGFQVWMEDVPLHTIATYLVVLLTI